MRPSVRIHQAVHAEISVVGIFPGIPAVVVNVPAVLRFSFPGGVVAPLPDETTAEFILGVHQFHIILDVPGAVAHGVDKLAQNQRFFHPAVFAVLLYPLHGRIHPAHHVQHGQVVFVSRALPDASFVMEKPGGIIFFDPSARLFEILPVAALVAHGPENYAAFVFVPDYIALLPVEKGFLPVRILGQQGEGVLIAAPVNHGGAVAFQIRFRDQIKAVDTAQFREPWRVGIMAGADGVNIVFLHQKQIPHSVFPAHRSPFHRMAVVTVYAPEFHLFLVNQDDAVFYVYGTDPHLADDHLAGGMQF